MASSTTTTTTRKSILTVSLARHLHGKDASELIAQDWDTNASADQKARFNNQGFNLDPKDEEGTLLALRERLSGTMWDGVLVGWCSRGNKAHTVLFERAVNEIVAEVVRRKVEGQGKDGDTGLKIMFCSGPDDLFNATLRSFP